MYNWFEVVIFPLKFETCVAQTTLFSKWTANWPHVYCTNVCKNRPKFSLIYLPHIFDIPIAHQSVVASYIVVINFNCLYYIIYYIYTFFIELSYDCIIISILLLLWLYYYNIFNIIIIVLYLSLIYNIILLYIFYYIFVIFLLLYIIFILDYY